MCGASFSASSWARLSSFWLALLFALVQVPINGQSTNNGPGQNESSQNVLSVLNNQADTLVMRLTLRPKQIEDSETSFRKIIEDYEARWMLSEAGWEKSQKDHEETLSLLSKSRADFDSYVQSSEDRARIDAEALTAARTERDQAKAVLTWVGIGSAIAGALIALGLSAIF